MFPELSRAKTGRGREAGACEFRRSAVSPAPGGRSADPDAMRRILGHPGGIEDREQQAYCRGFDEGVRSGIAQGEKAGEEAARQRLGHGLASVQVLLRDLEGLRRAAAAELEGELVQLALAVARKIVQHEIGVAPEAVAAIVRQALNRVENPARIRIRLHPEDVKLLGDVSPPLMSGRPEAGRVELEPDASITRGGCLIATDGGEIDARLERQFQVVEEAFRAEFERARAAGSHGS
jgi:flagellar biosynthesis/type III secretory pathway protein FliH